MIAKVIDYAQLQMNVTSAIIEQVCSEVLKYNFRGLCVNSIMIPQVSGYLKSAPEFEIISTIGFPLGTQSTKVKITEAEWACNHGATELDVVWNLGMFLDDNYAYVLKELNALVAFGKPVKVIVEVGELSYDDLTAAYDLVQESGAQYIKTSTGFSKLGNNLEIVKLWKQLGDLKIKASGGINTVQHVIDLINVGADLIGTSHAPLIMSQDYANPKMPE